MFCFVLEMDYLSCISQPVGMIVNWSQSHVVYARILLDL